MMRFTIKRRLAMTFLVLTGLLAMGAGAGYIGIQKLSDTLRFITRDAWDAADGGMETVIGLQGQIIVLNAMARSEGDLAARREQLQNFEDLERQATRRMLNSGLLDQSIIVPYQRLHAQYHKAKLRLLDAIDSRDQEAVTSATATFKASTDRLISFLYGMEEAADGAVENEAQAIASAEQLAYTVLWVALLVGLLVAGVAYLTSVQFIVQPIQATADRLHDIARGNGGLSTRLTPRGNDEVTDLVQAFNLFIGRLEDAVEQQSRPLDVMEFDTDLLPEEDEKQAELRAARRELLAITARIESLSRKLS